MNAQNFKEGDVMTHDHDGAEKKCSACGESIRAEAIKCRWCGSDVATIEQKVETARSKLARARWEYENLPLIETGLSHKKLNELEELLYELEARKRNGEAMGRAMSARTALDQAIPASVVASVSAPPSLLRAAHAPVPAARGIEGATGTGQRHLGGGAIPLDESTLDPISVDLDRGSSSIVAVTIVSTIVATLVFARAGETLTMIALSFLGSATSGFLYRVDVQPLSNRLVTSLIVGLAGAFILSGSAWTYFH